MSDASRKAREPKPPHQMGSLLFYRLPFSGSAAMWVALIALATLNFWGITSGNRGESVSRDSLLIQKHAFFILLCTLGLILRWGPVIPCMMLGIMFSLVLPATDSHSSMGRLIQEVTHLVIGGVTGATAGFITESFRGNGSR